MRYISLVFINLTITFSVYAEEFQDCAKALAPFTNEISSKDGVVPTISFKNQDQVFFLRKDKFFGPLLTNDLNLKNCSKSTYGITEKGHYTQSFLNLEFPQGTLPFSFNHFVPFKKKSSSITRLFKRNKEKAMIENLALNHYPRTEAVGLPTCPLAVKINEDKNNKAAEPLRRILQKTVKTLGKRSLAEDANTLLEANILPSQEKDIRKFNEIKKALITCSNVNSSLGVLSATALTNFTLRNKFLDNLNGDGQNNTVENTNSRTPKEEILLPSPNNDSQSTAQKR